MIQRYGLKCVVSYTYLINVLYASSVNVLERAETKVALLKKAETLVGSLRQNEEERDSLLAQRACMCRKLREAGASIEDLQNVLGISRSRVQQILRETVSAA